VLFHVFLAMRNYKIDVASSKPFSKRLKKVTAIVNATVNFNFGFTLKN